MRNRFILVFVISVICLCMGIGLYVDCLQIEAEVMSLHATSSRVYTDIVIHEKIATIILMIISAGISVASGWVIVATRKYNYFEKLDNIPDWEDRILRQLDLDEEE